MGSNWKMGNSPLWAHFLGVLFCVPILFWALGNCAWADPSTWCTTNSESEFKILNFRLNENLRLETSHFCLRICTKCNYTAETRVRYPKSICGICSGQNGTGIHFSPTTLVAPINYHSTYRFPLTVMPLNYPYSQTFFCHRCYETKY